MFLFPEPLIDLWAGISLMIIGEWGCRVRKGKIDALITSEECAEVPKICRSNNWFLKLKE